MITDNEELNEKLYELQQEINRLRGQVTYLQEQLYSAEDDLTATTERFEVIIEGLEQQLGNALYGDTIKC